MNGIVPRWSLPLLAIRAQSGVAPGDEEVEIYYLVR
jgi:hypothetical protein